MESYGALLLWNLVLGMVSLKSLHSGRLQTLLAKIGPGWKCFSGTNALAYSPSSSVKKKKGVLRTLSPGSHMIKLFMTIVIYLSKLECFPLSVPTLTFMAKARRQP